MYAIGQRHTNTRSHLILVKKKKILLSLNSILEIQSDGLTTQNLGTRHKCHGLFNTLILSVKIKY